jgi:tetratricopeptide (TPR) repeat protein
MLFDQNLLRLNAHKHSYSWLSLALKLALGLAGSTIAHASSTSQDTIKQAIQAGQLDQALKLVIQERQNAPKDAQLRFMEGVIQAQQGQTDKAIETFKKLTETHPDLSEAYNNLGVLYASKGKLEESRSQFEKALLTHPSYAAAHRNLSDVQSQLAKQTYAKALQIDSKIKNSTPQLTLLGSIDPSKRAPVLPAAPVLAQSGNLPSTTATNPSSKPSPVTSTPAEAIAAPASTTAKPAVTPPTPAVAPKPAPVLEAPAPVAAAKAEPPKDDAQQKLSKADQTELRQSINAWAKAWSQKDMPRYLASYASSFTPADKMSRAKWESDRRVRIVSKKTISVDINNLKLELAPGNKAIARFQQVYESDNFKGNSNKTLEMVKQGDRWLISRETVN